MQQPPQYPYGPPPYQQPYPTQYPYQPPPPPARTGHGAVYWILFILFFPITVPFVILKAILTGGSRQSMPSAPYQQQQPVHPQPTPRHHHRHITARQVGNDFRKMNRFLNSRPKKKW